MCTGQGSVGGCGRLRRLLVLAAALVLCLPDFGLVSAAAPLCPCTRGDLRDDLDSADVVFKGTVARTRTVERPEPGHIETTFTVSRVYKGTAYAEQVVQSPPSPHQCGIEAPPGAVLVIFATQQIDADAGVARLVTSGCRGNLAGKSPPALLGRGSAPLTGSSEDVDRAVRLDRTLTKALTIGAVTVGGSLLLGGTGVALLWRRRPRP